MWEKSGAYHLVHGVTWIGSTRYSSYIEDYWPCAGELSGLIAMGMQLRDPINSRLTRWRFTIYLVAVAERRRAERRPRVSTGLSLGCGK